MERRYKCRCCGYFTLIGESESDIQWEICPVCFWENDIREENPDRHSGANHMTLAQGRANFKNYSACEPGAACHVRAPRAEELPENNG